MLTAVVRYDSACASAASVSVSERHESLQNLKDDLLLKKRLRLHSRPDARAIGGAERTKVDDGGGARRDR
jgi:hypothetical protein